MLRARLATIMNMVYDVSVGGGRQQFMVDGGINNFFGFAALHIRRN